MNANGNMEDFKFDETHNGVEAPKIREKVIPERSLGNAGNIAA